MPLHVHKKGIRAMGVAESFVKGVGKKSIISGVVMRSDMIVDGFTFSNVTVGGMDATQKIVELYESLKREGFAHFLATVRGNWVFFGSIVSKYMIK